MAEHKPGKPAQQTETQQAAVPAKEAPKFKVKNSITIPWITDPQVGVPMYVRVLEKIHKSDVPQADQSMAPGDCARVLMLESGTLRMLGFGAVLKSNFDKAFPNDSYVGKDFQLTPTGMKRGRNAAKSSYRQFGIDEIEWNAAIPGQS